MRATLSGGTTSSFLVWAEYALHTSRGNSEHLETGRRELRGTKDD